MITLQESVVMTSKTVDGVLKSRAWMRFDGLAGDDKPVETYKGVLIANGSVIEEIDTESKYKYDEENSQWRLGSGGSVSQQALAEGIASMATALEEIAYPEKRITSLTETPLAAGLIVESVGIPIYVDDVSDYSAYGLTETGWYALARIKPKDGSVVSSEISIEGATGYIATAGEDHIDVAVKFDVAAESQSVSIDWGTYEEIIVFKATDLAVRNLDYRSTYYVYDIAPYTTWTFAVSSDTDFVDGTHYYTKSGDTYTEATCLYYEQTISYALTADTTFVADKEYYTESEGTYTLAEVTEGETVTENTYYEQSISYTRTEDTTFSDGKTYYTKDGSTYTEATVTAGDDVPAIVIYYEQEISYALTEDTAFVDGTDYYTESGGEYTLATVTAGETVAENTYYVQSVTYTRTEDTAIAEGKTYYTTDGTTYTEAVVTAGDAITDYYVHSKVSFEGMIRNVTYKLDTIIDCPIEIVLPEIPDDGYGAWFEISMRYKAQYSATLVPPSDDVKIATDTTPSQTKGINTLDLHYNAVGGSKVWRLINTHSNYSGS